MEINRREFVATTCALAGGYALGCAGGSAPPGAPVPLRVVSIDAGPVGDYAADGVYARFHGKGFFVVRRGDRLFVLSAICTHRTCPLRVRADHSFYCKCHGSTFSPEGAVTEGPATRDLPVLPTSVDDSGHLIVHALTT